MNADILSDALGGIDLKYVEQAEAYRRPRARARRAARLAAAAASGVPPLALASLLLAPLAASLAAGAFAARGRLALRFALERAGKGRGADECGHGDVIETARTLVS